LEFEEGDWSLVRTIERPHQGTGAFSLEQVLALNETMSGWFVWSHRFNEGEVYNIADYEFASGVVRIFESPCSEPADVATVTTASRNEQIWLFQGARLMVLPRTEAWRPPDAAE